MAIWYSDLMISPEKKISTKDGDPDLISLDADTKKPQRERLDGMGKWIDIPVNISPKPLAAQLAQTITLRLASKWRAEELRQLKLKNKD